MATLRCGDSYWDREFIPALGLPALAFESPKQYEIEEMPSRRTSSYLSRSLRTALTSRSVVRLLSALAGGQ